MGWINRTDRAFGVACGLLLDQLLGDPSRHHPVAWFGTAADKLAQKVYRPNRIAGVGFWVLAVVPVTGVAWWVQHRSSGVGRVATLAAVTWMVVGGRTLARVGTQIETHLIAGDLDAARELLPWLVGRDPHGLSAPDISRAVIESVAENTADAVTAPVFWGIVAGLPGLVAYRCSNTLDAMVGHKNARYEHFGWCSARMDDLVNLLPARLTAGALVLCAPVVGGAMKTSWQIWRRDAAKHPSPNAGPIEAAAAGALGVQLGGQNSYYGGHTEDRGTLGDGRPVVPRDIRRMVRLAGAATLLSTVTVVAAQQISKGMWSCRPQG